MKMIEDERPARHFKGTAEPGEQRAKAPGARGTGLRFNGLDDIPRALYLYTNCAKQTADFNAFS